MATLDKVKAYQNVTIIGAPASKDALAVGGSMRTIGYNDDFIG
jgi:hypothetical protein